MDIGLVMGLQKLSYSVKEVHVVECSSGGASRAKSELIFKHVRGIRAGKEWTG